MLILGGCIHVACLCQRIFRFLQRVVGNIYIITQLAIYTACIPGICCFLWGCIFPKHPSPEPEWSIDYGGNPFLTRTWFQKALPHHLRHQFFEWGPSWALARGLARRLHLYFWEVRSEAHDFICSLTRWAASIIKYYALKAGRLRKVDATPRPVAKQTALEVENGLDYRPCYSTMRSARASCQGPPYRWAPVPQLPTTMGVFRAPEILFPSETETPGNKGG